MPSPGKVGLFLVLWLISPGFVWSVSSDRPVVRLVVTDNSDFEQVRQEIQDFLLGGGFAMASGGQYDAMLRVEVKGTQYSAKYGPFVTGAGVAESTGADIEGTLLLEVGSRPTVEKTFRGVSPTPFQLKDTLPIPLRFKDALVRSDFFAKLSEAMEGAFTSQFLLDFWVRRMAYPQNQVARDTVARIGVAAIEPLLNGIRARALTPEDVSEVLTRIRNSDGLVRFMGDPDERVRWCVVDALGRLRDAPVEPLLAKALTEDQDASVRARAALYLRYRPTASDVLRRALRDQDWHVRAAAAQSLGMMGDKDALADLVDLLKGDRNVQARISVLSAVSSLGAVELLIPSLSDPDADVRKSAADFLGAWREPTSVGPLINAMQGQPASVRGIIAGALKQITKQDFGLDAQSWAKWWETHPKR
ncbi:MAG: HEAT repeat domain-containing protein [Bryobacteraceae bacterium]|jgi:hypothetical protein